jgi:hypothetical protein
MNIQIVNVFSKNNQGGNPCAIVDNACYLNIDEMQSMATQCLEVEKEVSKRTPYGIRYIDIEVSRNGVCLGGIEVKSGKPPPNIAQQRKDAWLLREKNYRVNIVRYPYP